MSDGIERAAQRIRDRYYDGATYNDARVILDATKRATRRIELAIKTSEAGHADVAGHLMRAALACLQGET